MAELSDFRCLDDEFGRLLGDLDVRSFNEDDVGEALTVAARLENRAAAFTAMVAVRIAEIGTWRSGGHRSAAHHVANATGVSVGQAGAAIETARTLRDLGATDAATRAGELSARQVSLIADAARTDPHSEQRLIDQARRSSVAELAGECARTKAAVTDPEVRRAAIHSGRFLRSYSDTEGGWNLRVRNTPEVGAQIMARLAPLTDRVFRCARAEGRRESLEAYAADALTEMAEMAEMAEVAVTADAPRPEGTPDAPGDGATGPARPPSRPKIIVRVDFDALLRGYPTEGEVCEIVGIGPMAVSAVREMIDSQDPFLAAVVTKGQTLHGVAHLGRRASATQTTALEWLYPACAVEGCAAQSFLEVDHRQDWSRTHFTLLDLLDRLCRHHHSLKTRDNWSLVEGHGKRAFVCPADPRHPGRSTKSPGSRGGKDPPLAA